VVKRDSSSRAEGSFNDVDDKEAAKFIVETVDVNSDEEYKAVIEAADKALSGQ